MIEVDDRVASGVMAETLVEVVDAVLVAEGASGAEVGIVLVDEAAMQALNRVHRAVDAPTDVLAFPIDDDGMALAGVPRMLGDVVICIPIAVRQAAEHGEAPGDELRELLVHGTLHLLGYDHEVDDGEMLARQAELIGGVSAIVWDPTSPTP